MGRKGGFKMWSTPRTFTRRLKKGFRLFVNRVRIDYGAKKEGRKIHLIIPEKYKTTISGTLRIVLVISIVLSFVTLPSPFSLIVSLSLIIVEQIAEHTIFSRKSLLLVPHPSYEVWKSANFLGMFFEAEMQQRITATVGMFFENEENAKEVFKFIKEWNYDSEDDRENNNIIVSFVVDKTNNKYAFFAYPSMERKSVNTFIDMVRKKKRADIHGIPMVGQIMLCKLFDYRGSGFEQFEGVYTNGNSYYFRAMVYDGEGVNFIEDVAPILKKDIKIIDKDDLGKRDLEKFMCDYNIEWEDDSYTPPSVLYKYNGKEYKPLNDK